jgi:hypothetical protein
MDRLVTTLCEFVRPSDFLRHGCLWERMVKPLVRPLVGYERGFFPKVAADPPASGESGWRFLNRAELLAHDSRPRVPATTDTEQWMRTSEAWDAVTRVLLARMWDADPANGCGIGRAPARPGHDR